MNTLREKIETEVPHYYCEDSWYSCPEATEGCADESVIGCRCGRKEKVDSILSIFANLVREKRKVCSFEQDGTPEKCDCYLYNESLDDLLSALEEEGK